MKAKKWLTIITFCCSILALLCSIFIGKESACIIYDIAMAVFGSAMLGFIMSLTEYFVERRRAMESFWDEARKAVQNLQEYHYLDLDVPVEIIMACFREEQSNEMLSIISPDKPLVHKAKNDLIAWYEEHQHPAWTENDDIAYEEERLYNSKIEYYRELFSNCINNCIDISDMDLGPLENAYDNLDFLFGNRHLRKKAFDNVYEKIVRCRGLSENELYHFKLFKEGHGSFPVCAQKAYDIIHKVFTETETVNNGVVTKEVYQTATDEIYVDLEKFRCRIYYKSDKKSHVKVAPVIYSMNTLEQWDNDEHN